MPITFWIVGLALMVAVLALQSATRYTASDKLADLLSDAGFYIILIFLVGEALFTLRLYQRHQHVSFRTMLWLLAAFGCWWLFFWDDSRDPLEK
jgi:hypothetical protein